MHSCRTLFPVLMEEFDLIFAFWSVKRYSTRATRWEGKPISMRVLKS